jgi:hypothetical protein
MDGEEFDLDLECEESLDFTPKHNFGEDPSLETRESGYVP